MKLKAYFQKRDRKKTPEPFGGKSKGKALRFVVQKHAASHLHYDFRLEWKGVLKSWAIPKGPSKDPKDKRLAVLVEDHPLDYIDFEGVIPEGNYGAGTVKIWDKGTYEPQAEFAKGLTTGKLSFILHGKKLKGSFSLVRMKTDSKKENWLFIKHA